VLVWLADRDAMLAYGPHPKHQELMALQSTKLTPDGKCVLDPSMPEIQARQKAVSPASDSPMVLHVVGLKFVPEMSEADIEAHFETEAALHERMPELIPSREHWSFCKNNSGPLFPETDRGAGLNHGSEWIVLVWLADRDAMLAYGPHPKHQELMALQSTKLTPDGKCVLDPSVATAPFGTAIL
jgi:hypothetical protein